MNSSKLRKLFRGELVPLEGKHIVNAEIESLNETIEENWEYFDQILTLSEMDKLDDYTNALCCKVGLQSEELQYQQFLLGIKVGLEIGAADNSSDKFVLEKEELIDFEFLVMQEFAKLEKESE
ncbi:MAG: hypothetical protein R3Y54_10880 [Eubacteriales bacterium]